MAQCHPASASNSARSNGSDPAGNQPGRPSTTQGSLRYRTPRVLLGSAAETSGTFDTLTAARKLEAAGMDRKQAEAVAGVVRAGQGEFATRADLSALEVRFAAALHRAMAIQAAGIVATLAALACIVIGLASLWNGQ